MQITENLWQVGGSDLTAPEDAASYLVRMGNAAALIDAGCGNDTPALIENIARVLPREVPITHLLLTHCHFDHTGGAEAMRSVLGCKIAAHRLDAAFLEAGESTVTAAAWYGRRMPPLPIDLKIDGPTESFQVGNGEIMAYHCPGHSPGSMVYTADIDGRKILFGQDIHGPLHPSLLSDRSDYLKSLQFILDLDADILCEGHFGIFHGRDEVRKFIRSFITGKD
ncbi:MAG: MBL fold metallo-hydrolase [Desulfobacteraceae bacterium]|nr:MAG: MBL fold metallo-hydrolase [Desulfobacteraceae bacterium]